jgi:hypothetical protein
MRQQPQQAQQAPPAATINLDDLLGLNDEPLPQASHLPAATHLDLSISKFAAAQTFATRAAGQPTPRCSGFK